jgi:hypothetical protein
MSRGEAKLEITLVHTYTIFPKRETCAIVEVPHGKIDSATSSFLHSSVSALRQRSFALAFERPVVAIRLSQRYIFF